MGQMMGRGLEEEPLGLSEVRPTPGWAQGGPQGSEGHLQEARVRKQEEGPMGMGPLRYQRGKEAETLGGALLQKLKAAL